MPGFYADGEYDVAGFIVGVVDRERASSTGAPSCPATCSSACPRRACTPTATRSRAGSRSTPLAFASMPCVPELGRDDRRGAPRAAPILPAGRAPAARASGLIKGMAHITGGGITDNLPRVLPAGTHARIDRSTWQPPAIFRWLQRTGGVPDADMLRTFNMGIGLILACAPDREHELIDAMASAGEPGAVRIGEIRAGGGGVVYG